MKIMELIQDFTGIEFSVLATFSLFIAFFTLTCVRVVRFFRA